MFDKLLPYGFTKDGETYILSKKICDDALRIEVRVSNSGTITGKIYDVAYGDEYTNYRITSQTGTFVNQVRQAFEELLMDIKKNCTTSQYFITAQANRLSAWMENNYHSKPEFLWSDSPGYGVFRNHTNGKWYGIIMNIDKSKLENSKGEVEILNLKLDPDTIKMLILKKNYYRAYHMNKKYWITILLDDSLPDDEIIKYIKESHRLTS